MSEKKGATRREVLAAGVLGAAGLMLPRRAYADPANTPTFAAFSDTTSVFPGAVINFYVVGPQQAAFTMVIQELGAGAALGGTAVNGGSTVWNPGTPANIYAVGYPLGSPNVSFTIPSGTLSGLYVATFTDLSDTTKTSQVPFLVKAPWNGPTPPVLCMIAFNTGSAYNGWGGASAYHTDPGEAGPYLQPLDESDPPGNHTYQVSFNRPWDNWHDPGDGQGNPLYYPLDWHVFTNAINFFKATLGASSIGYASNIDLHFGTVSANLNNYNLMLSLGHDEYWSWEMRNTVEAFIAGGGNVAFLNGNTCWWQVRFESRDSNGNLVNGNDPRTIVAYKLAGVLPVSQQPDYRAQPYNFYRDPVYGTSNSNRTATNWWATPVSRPENYMTGLSWRNGAFNDGSPANEYLPVQVSFTTQFPQHWAYGAMSMPSQFATNVLSSKGVEMDGAVVRTNGYGQIEPTGEDGTPLNYTVLGYSNPQTWPWPGSSGPGGQGGYVAMGLYRNNGVVFNAATLGWIAGLGDPTSPAHDPYVDNITANVLRRLKQRGPWKYEQHLPNGNPLPGYYLRNSYFESWTNGRLNNWIVECPQNPPGTQLVWQGSIVPQTGNHALIVDGNGQVWITQDTSGGYALQCERYTKYRLGVFVNATAVGAVSIWLQDQNGNQFCRAQNQTANQWEEVSCIGYNATAGAFFPAHVVMVVNDGNWGMFSDVSVFEWPTGGSWLTGFNGRVTK